MRSSPRPPNPRIKMALPALLVDSEQAASLLNLQEVALACPAQALVKYEARNVVGYLPGTDPGLKDECIIFSAHLDHLGTVSNGQADPIYNGADDDASGVTAVLTLADAFSKTEQQPKRSILFVTFWGEESGLLGSRDFAASPPWDLNKVVANINIEMIGRPEPGANSKVWMTGWEKSDLGELMNEASKSVGVDIFDHPKYSSMLYRQSDNYSLAEKGVVAHSFSAGSLHSDYHQPSDEWEKLNLPHMTEVIKGLFIGSTPLVYSESRPQKAEK